jgi:hypothetical protein
MERRQQSSIIEPWTYGEFKKEATTSIHYITHFSKCPTYQTRPPVEMDIREMPARSPRRIEVLDRTPSPPTTNQQSKIFSTSPVLSPNITVRPRFRRIVHSDIATEIPDHYAGGK